MHKKKIVIITLQNVRNYGSVLQAFCTQKKFEEEGFEAEFINFKRADMKSVFSRLKNWVKGEALLTKITKCVVLLPSFLYQEYIFNKFTKRYLNVQGKVYTSEEDFKLLPIDAEVYCTGSDQVWNSKWNSGLLKPLFLSFVPDTVRKISYAASFGKSQLDDCERSETGKLLSRYNSISVREESGVNIIKNLGIENATHVLDPTLHMPKSFWERYAGESKSSLPYVLIYQLNSNKAFDDYAIEYARRKGLKLIRFCTRFDQIIKNGESLLIPSVFDFVSYIFHADCVITDSFHATAFSINVNTDFISIYPEDFSTRIDSILTITNLKDRHLKSYEDFSYVDRPAIDFTYVNTYLKLEREKSDIFLRRALGNINSD